MTKKVSKLIFLSGFFLSLAAIAELAEKPGESEAPMPISSSRNWGVGLSLSAEPSFGLKTEYKLSSDWMASLNLSTKSGTCCLGDNPSAGTPYGYQIEGFRKNAVSLLLSRSFEIGSSHSWAAVVGAGIGFTDTISRAQFYNQAFIGYDLNSPAGSDSIRQQRVTIPAQAGFRRSTTLLDHQMILSLLLEAPLNGRGDTPKYTAPNGRTVSPNTTYFEDGGVKFEAVVYL